MKLKSCGLHIKDAQRGFTYQLKFLLLFALQLFYVLREVWPVEVVVQLPLDLQHFIGDANEGLSYLVDQLPVVVEVIVGPCPQVRLVPSGGSKNIKQRMCRMITCLCVWKSRKLIPGGNNSDNV